MQQSQDLAGSIALSNDSAVGYIRAIQDAGLTVPQNVSVVGIDDIQIVGFISPRLTTVRQPLKHMGEMAASTLLQRIQGLDVPEETVVQPELVVRESTSRVNTEP